MIKVWIQKQRNGTYSVRSRTTEGGEQPAVYCGWDRELAKRIVIEKKQDYIYRKLNISTPNKDLKELLAEYLDDYAKSKSAYTASQLKYVLNIFIKDTIKLGGITKEYIYRYREEQLKKYSPFTVRSRLRSVSAFMGWCVKRGFLDSSPFKGIEVPNPQPTPKFMTDEQLAALDKEAKGKLKLAFRIAYTTGFRRSNVLALSYEDIQDGMFIVQRAKGKKPISVPVHPSVKVLLDPRGRGRIFPDLGKHKLRHLWDKLRKKAKVTGVRWHSARHTFTKKALQSGMTTFEVMKFTGHAAPQSMIPYAHFEMGRLKDRYKKIKFGAAVPVRYQNREKGS